MAKCSHCSAPLPKSGIICNYCGTRNDIDLEGYEIVGDEHNQKRSCPTCHIDMQTIDIGKEYSFLIQRCESCYGIFFDNNELETLVNNSIKGSSNIDLVKLSQINQNPRHIDIIVYKKCPVCQNMMLRKNYMKRSGVITDVCSEHGIWLDSGELRQILEWTKTGGAEKIKEEQDSMVYRQKNSQYSKKTETRNSYVEKENSFIDFLDSMFFPGSIFH